MATNSYQGGAPALLLAHKWNGKSDLTGWWMSEKLDGVRAYWTGSQFVSRLGNTYHAPAWFTKSLPKYPLDGELWVGRKLFQKTVSVVRRANAGDEWKNVRYLVFDAPAADGDAKKWDAALARLQPAVEKAMTDKRGDLAAINRSFDFAKDQAADGNYESALKAAAKTAELLKQAATMETTAAAQEAADITPEGLVKLRVAWIETRLGMQKEIEGLKSAIDDATKNIDGMEEVSSKSKVLFDYVADIDTNLEQTLQKMADAKDEKSRDALKSDAMQIVDTYKGVLDSDFFKAVDDNGFVKTNIRDTALNSLQQVSAALAA